VGPRNGASKFMGAAFCALVGVLSLASQEAREPAKKVYSRGMSWDPPNVEAGAPVVAGESCDVKQVLAKAGAAAKAQEDNLPNFTADERIQYEYLNSEAVLSTDGGDMNAGGVRAEGSGTFEYLAEVAQNEQLAVKETRTPKKGTVAFAASSFDVNLPEMDFIFLPARQTDFLMKCEGKAKWGRQDAWVIRFVQSPDRLGHTLYFKSTDQVYDAKLKGRAWIAADNGAVIHLEIAIMEPIPQVKVRNWWLALDYAPVQFHSRDVKIWLPQTVDAYAKYDAYRTIIYHTFANFMLFSVQTDQKIEKPAEAKPQN